MIGAAAMLVLAVAATGCVRVELPRGEFTQSSEGVALQGAEKVRARVEMGAGKLTIGDADTELMKAEFGYTNAGWRPEVDYSVSGTTGNLSVSTPDRLHIDLGQNNRYEWDLGFAPDVPLDLTVGVGAGEAKIDLSALDIRDLQVDVGAGDTLIDLSGTRTHDMTGNIGAGAGKVTLRVPRDIGVRIVGYKDGIGRYQADGFIQDGDALVNPAYEDATVKLDLTLVRGVGEVVIEMVP